MADMTDMTEINKHPSRIDYLAINNVGYRLSESARSFNRCIGIIDHLRAPWYGLHFSSYYAVYVPNKDKQW